MDMDLNMAKTIIGDMPDNEISVLLERAKKLAKNHYFWKSDDVPNEFELQEFYDRYEFEIYDIAKTVYSAESRGGLQQFTELGVTRVWGKTGEESINVAVSNIPTKTYIV